MYTHVTLINKITHSRGRMGIRVNTTGRDSSHVMRLITLLTSIIISVILVLVKQYKTEYSKYIKVQLIYILFRNFKVSNITQNKMLYVKFN